MSERETSILDEGLLDNEWDPERVTRLRGRLQDLLGARFTLEARNYEPWLQGFILDFLRDLDEDKKPIVKAFLESGNERNRLITLASMRRDDEAIETLLIDYHDGRIGYPPFGGPEERLFEVYAQIVASARQIAMTLVVLYKKAFPEENASVATFFDLILRRNKALLFKTIKESEEAIRHPESQSWLEERVQSHFLTEEGSEDERAAWRREYIMMEKGFIYGEAANRLVFRSPNVVYMQEFLAALGREELSTLDLKTLFTTEIHNISTTEFRDSQYNDIRDQMIATIQINFPGNDAHMFASEFLNDEGNKLHFSIIDGQLVCFFGSTEIAEETYYLDWFNRAQYSPVGRLAEATLFTANVRQGQFKRACLVAKPYVASLAMALRNGFVVSGLTNRNQGYQHLYLHCRKLESEAGDIYLGARLTDKNKAEVRANCQELNQLVSLTIDQTETRVCRVEFKNRSHKNDIQPANEDGYILRTVDKLCSNGEWVMTAYFPDEKSSSKHQIYYAVFERSAVDKQELQDLETAKEAFYKKSAA